MDCSRMSLLVSRLWIAFVWASLFWCRDGDVVVLWDNVSLEVTGKGFKAYLLRDRGRGSLFIFQ